MNKFYITVLVFLLTWATAAAQSCLPEGITFTTQEEVDNFSINYPGCSVVEGDVVIKQNVFFDIDSLTALSAIHAIGGSLNIEINNHLTSLYGLHNLTSIGGALRIYGNSKLNNLLALNSLTAIGSNLIISSNDTLTSLVGLNNLTTIKGILQIYANSELHNLSGLNGLKVVESGLIIDSNIGLIDLTGLDSLHMVGDLVDIELNSHLVTMQGLNNLQYIGGAFNIYYNIKLADITSLNSLQFVGDNFNIHGNHTLKNLAGLGNLNTINGNFEILYNKSLVGLVPFDHLHTIKGYLSIISNDSLLSLTGLDSIRVLGGGLGIKSNPFLTDLTALSQIDSISVNLEIWDNDHLIELTGLDNLRIIGGNFSIYNNDTLSDINGLANVQSLSGNLWIINNPHLSACAIYPVCNQLSQRPEAIDIGSNGPGCDSPLAVELACGGLPIVVTVRLDNNENCLVDTADVLAEGILVHLSGSVQQGLRPTQSDGTARFGYLNSGEFSITLPQFPLPNWELCQDTLWFLTDTIQDTIRANFLLKPLIPCPDMSVNLWLPPVFRGCLVNSTMQAVVQNAGTVPAEAVQVAIVLPTELELVSSIPPLVSQNGDTLFFALGNLPPFVDGTVDMTVRTICDSFLLGQSLCVEALIGLANPCPNLLPASSEIRLFSQCLGDTVVRFIIKNVGDAPTQAIHEYVIIEDEVILRSENFNLNPLQSMTVDVPTDGSTYRMEATKYDDGTLTASALENCGGFTPGFITVYWLNDGRRSYDFDCRQVSLAYDPNQKTAIPTGVGPEHLLAANKPIQYTIDFQNTGTDTAFRVQLLDILPEQLDVNSFRPGFSSHAYTWEIRGTDTLEVLFYPIMLPDSNVNEAASHGWFSFEINQKPNLPDGTTIENTAAIVFDYNPPIVTNTVLHTIGKLTVSVDDPQDAAQAWQIFNNPTRYAATFKAKEFIAGEKRFELSDAMGRVVRTEHFSGQEFEFRRDALAGGLYYFRIVDARGRIFSGKIMVSE